MSRSGVVVAVVALSFAVAVACGKSDSNPGSKSGAGAGGEADSTVAGASTGGSRAGGGEASGGVSGSVGGKGGAQPTAGDGGASGPGGASEPGGASGSGGAGGAADVEPSAGAAGSEAGAGGAGPIATSCEAASPTVKPSCAAGSDPDGDEACPECLKSECCSEWQACYGTSPRNACGYGEQVGDALGEADCIRLCWYQTYDGTKSDTETLSACADQCAACADTFISDVTNVLISCAYEECADSCFPTDF